MTTPPKFLALPGHDICVDADTRSHHHHLHRDDHHHHYHYNSPHGLGHSPLSAPPKFPIFSTGVWDHACFGISTSSILTRYSTQFLLYALIFSPTEYISKSSSMSSFQSLYVLGSPLRLLSKTHLYC